MGITLASPNLIVNHPRPYDGRMTAIVRGRSGSSCMWSRFMDGCHIDLGGLTSRSDEASVMPAKTCHQSEKVNAER